MAHLLWRYGSRSPIAGGIEMRGINTQHSRQEGAGQSKTANKPHACLKSNQHINTVIGAGAKTDSDAQTTQQNDTNESYQ